MIRSEKDEIYRGRPATFIQRAGAEAFNAMSTKYGKEVMKAHKVEYDRRRQFFCKRMDEIEGLPAIPLREPSTHTLMYLRSEFL